MRNRHEIGVGLVSVGWMGKLHTKAYQTLPIAYPELGVIPRLIIAADIAADRANFAKEILGYAESSQDYREVLAHPLVDVVSICSPNFMHSEIAIACAKVGKSFWLEKPAGRGVDETELIAVAADAAGVTTSIGFNYRNAPAVEYARKLIAEGALGHITNVRGTFFADYSADSNAALSWRFIKELAGSGVLGDLMGHLVDLMHYLVGPISEVCALTKMIHHMRPALPMGTGTHFTIIENGSMKEVENEDYAGILVRFAEDALGAGAVGTLEASRVAVGPRARYEFEIYGTNGSLKWNYERMNELEVATTSDGAHVGYKTIMAGPTFGDFSNFQPGAGNSMGYDDLKVIEAKKFLHAYIGGPSENSNIHDAVASARVTKAAEDSAQGREWIPVKQSKGTTAAMR